MADTPHKDVIGCGTSILALCVLSPMWYTLLGNILWRLDVPTWMWVVFWIYIPIGVLIGVLGAVVKLIDE